MTRQFACDSATLARDDAATLKRLVEAVTASPPSAPAHPDEFQYDVSVTDDSGSTRNFGWSETTLSEPVRALVEWMSKR